jgi:hypothetical protein
VPVLDKARTRLAGLKSIDAALDLGNDITLTVYEAEVVKTKEMIESYNVTLSTIDDLYNASLAQINVLKDLNERVLSGVLSKFGANSSQYEMAGGVRKSERKRPKKKGDA